MKDDPVSIPQRLHDLLSQRRPDADCDPCMAEAPGLTRSAHVQRNANAFGATSDSRRGPGQAARHPADLKLSRPLAA